MIKIITTSALVLGTSEEKCLSAINEYPKVYLEIITAIQFHKNITYSIQTDVISRWFRNMASRYPQGTFVFETLDARGVLSRRWGTEPPPSVSNEDILQTGLLSVDIQPQPGFTFEDILLAHFYAPVLTAKTFPFTQLTALLHSVDPQRWQANKAVPLLARTLHTRLEEWKSKTRTSEQRQLVDLVADNPPGLEQKLMQFRVLRSYPALGEALMGDTFELLKTLKLQLEDLEIEEGRIQETVLQVTYLLNNQKLSNLEALKTLIETVSGLLNVEFDTIEKVLIEHPDWITPVVMDQLEIKFASYNRKLLRRIDSLRSMIQPPKPTFPELTWDVDAMLSWVRESYLPYQAWCDKQERFDAELYPIGDRFSEWLMNHWDDIHANSKRMVFNILPNKAVELKRAGYVNLVLVIDNLGWSFAEMLRALFQDKGYYLTTAEAYLAMIPSETEISKKCLLSGAVGYQAIDDKSYKGIIEKGWVPYFNDTAFRYISDIGGLSSIQTVEASTYVVNYLAVDKALHKSSDEIGMPHRDHIQHLLEKMVENCVKFFEKHGLQEHIRIHIVSDHGSTRVPATIPNDLDPVFFKTIGFEARSHRYVTVSPDRFAGLADNLKLDCFFIPANDFLNPENVLCARRGNRFIPTDKDSYVHGGLLPEEMVVPYMLFEPTTVPLQDLTILLKKNEYRYRMETVELEIGNPNDQAVQQIIISILNGNVESDPFRVALLNGKTNLPLQMNARFKVTNLPEDQTYLRMRIRFSARGEQHAFYFQSKITMKKMVEEKSTDVFDL